MIQRVFGIIIGGCVTFLLLLLFDDGRIISDEITGFLTAVAIGAVVNALWPVIWRLTMARRAQVEQDEIVRAEVQRQVAAQQHTETERRRVDLGPSPLDE